MVRSEIQPREKIHLQENKNYQNLSILQLALLANKDPTLWLEAASSAQKYVCKNVKIYKKCS